MGDETDTDALSVGRSRILARATVAINGLRHIGVAARED